MPINNSLLSRGQSLLQSTHHVFPEDIRTSAFWEHQDAICRRVVRLIVLGGLALTWASKGNFDFGRDPHGKVKIRGSGGFSGGFGSCDFGGLRVCGLGSLFWCFDMISVVVVSWFCQHSTICYPRI